MALKAIDDIRITKTRCRKQYGDIDALAASIRALGQLQPIGIRPDDTLVCGERRIQALKTLGKSKVAVHVCHDLEDELRFLEAERDENTCRLPLTAAEAEAMAKRLKPKYDRLAKQAQKAGGAKGGKIGKIGGKGRPGNKAGNKVVGTSHNLKRDKMKFAREQAAASTGYSEKTLRKVAEIKEAVGDDPTLKSIADKLDRHDAKVDAIHKEYKKAVKANEDAAAAEVAKQSIRKTANNGIYHGDSFKLADSIPDASCALVFTDPPYDRDSLPMFDQLGALANRILVDGGSLVTYCGQYVMPSVIESLSHHLRFFWICCCLHTGGTAQMREYGIKIKWKPMLWFVNGTFRRDRSTWIDDLVRSREEKLHHPWQQSVIEATHFIEALTVPGELVVDPFCGSGTTALAAKEAGRLWWTADTNAAHVKTARERLT